MDEVTIHQLTREDIAHSLDANHLRVIQILQFALTAAPLAFLAVVLLVKATAAPAEATDDSTSRMMLLVLGPVAASIYVATAFMQRLMLSAPKLRAGLPDQDTPAGWVGSFINRHRTLTIIRMSLMESAAIIGLVVVLLAVFDGSLEDQPIKWLGLLPTAVHLLYSAVTFPSRAAVAQFIHQRMVKPLQRL